MGLGGCLDAARLVVVAADPVHHAAGEDLVVIGADGQHDAEVLGQGLDDVLRQRPLGHEVEPPAVGEAVVHPQGLEVGRRGVVLGVGGAEVADHADARVREHAALGDGLVVAGNCQRVGNRDVVLGGAGLLEAVVLRVPDGVPVAVLGLDDRLVEREPAADLLAKLAERLVGVVGVGLADLAVEPAAAAVEVGGQVKVVEVHKDLEPGLLGGGEQLVVPRRALGVDVAVLVEQAAPLDRGAVVVHPHALEDLEVLLVVVHEVVAHVGADLVVERADVLHGPSVPEVLQLAAHVPSALRLRTRHGRTEEEALGQGKLCHTPSIQSVFQSRVMPVRLSRFVGMIIAL